MLPGGDLYEPEESFFDFVKSRTENTVEEWVHSLRCPVIRVNGTNSIEENVNDIIFQSIIDMAFSRIFMELANWFT